MPDQIEGRRPVLEALRSGRGVSEIILAKGVRDAGPVSEIREAARERGVRVREMPKAEFDRRVRSRTPQGVMALVADFRYATIDHVLRAAGDTPLLAVALDGVTDPHNVGAIARSAEAAGAHGLLLPKRRSAGVTPTVEKAAAGALSFLPIAQVDNLQRSLDRLKQEGVWIVALDGEGETAVDALELASEPICLVVGAEGAGVSRLVRERADVRVRIPMTGRVGSLNASVAAGIALFEVARRRRTPR